VKSHNLKIPLTKEAVASLEAGDFLTLTGRLFTCRPLTYDRLLDSKEGEQVARRLNDLQANALFHCGPLVKKEGDDWRMLAMVPMPSWLAGPERISKAVDLLGLRLILGKGTLHAMGNFCAKSGCVHAVCAGNFNEYGLKVKRILQGYWMELGLPEAMWIFEAEEFGPFIVETDTKGNSLYKGGDELFKARARSILEELGIQLD
jgi:tartrate/fumarate subfamily iron-sulfur-dependent hydro-lyase beta chain